MRKETGDIPTDSSWQALSQELKRAVILSNSLPESFPALSHNTSRRTQTGVDLDRQTELTALFKGLDAARQAEFKAFEQKKRSYFAGYARRFQPILHYFKAAGMWGSRKTPAANESITEEERKRQLDWKAVPRQALVISETAGNIAQALKDQGVDIDPEVVRLAGIVHSLTKRLQVDHRNSLKARSDMDDYQKLRAGINFGMEKFGEILLARDIRNRLIRLAPALENEEKYQNFIKIVQSIGMIGSQEAARQELDPNEISQADAEMLKDLATRVLFYVHHIVKHSALVPINERISDALARYVTEESRASKIYKEIVERGRISGIIEKEIIAKLNVPLGEEMIEYLAKIFFEKLHKSI